MEGATNVQTEKKVNVAVLGLNMGGYHVDVLAKNPHANLVALCDLREDVLASKAQQYKVPHTFTDYRDMIDRPDIDAVVVALPVYLHAPVSLAFLEAGKHVLVEKPMASTVEDAQRMLDTARRKQLVLTIHHNQRFDPVTLFLKEYLAQGHLGHVHFARCVWTRPHGMLPSPDYRNWFNEKDKGGGVLFDLGTHLLDKVLSLFDFPTPVQVAATSFTVLGKEQERTSGMRFDADDLTVGMIEFDNGLTMQLEMSFGSHIEKELQYFELYGEKGGVTTRDGFKTFSALQGSSFTMSPNVALPRPVNPTVPDDFIHAILHKQEPVITPESALKVTRILASLRDAAAKGWGKTTQTVKS
jgi:predicted dehydrogenase